MPNSIVITEQIRAMDEASFMEPVEVLERVIVKDRNYTYDMNFRYGSFSKVWACNGRNSCLVHTNDTEREALQVVVDNTPQDDSMLFVNHRRSGFSLLSEGKWMHFAWDDGKIRQISPNPQHQSYADQAMLSLTKSHKLELPSDKPVLINGVDSFQGRDRQKEIEAGRRYIQKMAIIAALDHATGAHLDFVHALLTTQAKRRS